LPVFALRIDTLEFVELLSVDFHVDAGRLYQIQMKKKMPFHRGREV
jgi:hypothetical protein